MRFLFAVISQTGRNVVRTWRSQLLSLVTITLSVLIFAFFYLVYMNALHAGDPRTRLRTEARQLPLDASRSR